MTELPKEVLADLMADFLIETLEEKPKLSDFYEQGGKPRGKCSVCGTTEEHTYKSKSTKKKYPKPFYFSVFEKMDIFRGNDEYRGKICKNCLKAGRIEESRKVTPAPKGDSK